MIRLFLLGTVLAGLAFFHPVTVNASEIVSADKAAQLSQTNQVFLIDIRRPDEWKSSGVAASAHKISMHEEGFLTRLDKLVAGAKDAKIALICATGARSTWLSGELVKRGYSNVSNVSEGMFGSQHGPGWLRRGLPVNR